MSTTIDVYPGTGLLPPVEQTRARTQELFQQLLDRHGIGSVIEVEAFHPSDDHGPIRCVDDTVHWQKSLDVGLGYWINGEWESNSWPSCIVVEAADFVTEEDTVPPLAWEPEFIGVRRIIDELGGIVPLPKLDRILEQDHYWSEYRNAGGPAVASTGYGLAAAALAEATDGVLVSLDGAFDLEHNGETAEQFLTWWGDTQVGFFGRERFLAARVSSKG